MVQQTIKTNSLLSSNLSRKLIKTASLALLKNGKIPSEVTIHIPIHFCKLGCLILAKLPDSLIQTFEKEFKKNLFSQLQKSASSHLSSLFPYYEDSFSILPFVGFKLDTDPFLPDEIIIKVPLNKLKLEKSSCLFLVSPIFDKFCKKYNILSDITNNVHSRGIYFLPCSKKQIIQIKTAETFNKFLKIAQPPTQRATPQQSGIPAGPNFNQSEGDWKSVLESIKPFIPLISSFFGIRLTPYDVPMVIQDFSLRVYREIMKDQELYRKDAEALAKVVKNSLNLVGIQANEQQIKATIEAILKSGAGAILLPMASQIVPIQHLPTVLRSSALPIVTNAIMVYRPDLIRHDPDRAAQTAAKITISVAEHLYDLYKKYPHLSHVATPGHITAYVLNVMRFYPHIWANMGSDPEQFAKNLTKTIKQFIPLVGLAQKLNIPPEGLVKFIMENNLEGADPRAIAVALAESAGIYGHTGHPSILKLISSSPYMRGLINFMEIVSRNPQILMINPLARNIFFRTMFAFNFGKHGSMPPPQFLVSVPELMMAAMSLGISPTALMKAPPPKQVIITKYMPLVRSYIPVAVADMMKTVTPLPITLNMFWLIYNNPSLRALASSPGKFPEAIDLASRMMGMPGAGEAIRLGMSRTAARLGMTPENFFSLAIPPAGTSGQGLWPLMAALAGRPSMGILGDIFGILMKEDKPPTWPEILPALGGFMLSVPDHAKKLEELTKELENIK